MTKDRGDYNELISYSASSSVIKAGKACNKYWQRNKCDKYWAYFK